MLRELLSFPFVAGVGWLLAGCANRAAVEAHAETRRPKASPIIETPTASVVPGDQHADSPDAELRHDMEALLLERERFFAPEGNVGTTASDSRAQLRALPRTGAIPTKRVARVDAMAFNGKPGKGPVCTPEQEPIAPNGRLCGDVRLPLVTLTNAEMASVLRLLDDAENSHQIGHIRCDFVPHHALVLYDDAGQSLGTVTVCMSCGQWLIRPASPRTGKSTAIALRGDQRTTLASIFNDHGLGAWIFDDEDPRRGEVFAYERAVYGTEEEPTPRGIVRRRKRLEANPSGVDRTKKLDELTREDREALCLWTRESVRPSRRGLFDNEGHGYECPTTGPWAVDFGAKECGTRPLRCSATVGELEVCLRELRLPEDLCGPPVAVCEGLMRCLPGIKTL